MISRKIKIRKLIFHSIQHIAHLSWKWDQNWGGGGGSACPFLGLGHIVQSYYCYLKRKYMQFKKPSTRKKLIPKGNRSLWKARHLFLDGLIRVSNEIIIGAPLFLNELPKYQDKNLIGTWSPPKKKIFLATVLWCLALEKIQSVLNHKRKKYFHFWLHYYYGAWNLEKIQSDSTLTEKKKHISVSGYSTIMVHGT